MHISKDIILVNVMLLRNIKLKMRRAKTLFWILFELTSTSQRYILSSFWIIIFDACTSKLRSRSNVDDDDIYSATWDPPEEILNGCCNISKFEIITYFLNPKPKAVFDTVYSEDISHGWQEKVLSIFPVNLWIYHTIPEVCYELQLLYLL